MNKMRALSAAVLGCFSSFGMAQSAADGSSVTMYGIVDVGIHHVTGAPGGSKTSLTSGNMQGSRLGFKGNEDLGGGYRAVFTLESRLEADTGALGNRPISQGRLPDRLSNAGSLGLPAALQPAVSAVAAQIGNSVGVNLGNNFFDRQVFTGLVTPFGAFTFGRQYTPGYLANANFDAMKTESSLSLGHVGGYAAQAKRRPGQAPPRPSAAQAKRRPGQAPPRPSTAQANRRRTTPSAQREPPQANRPRKAASAFSGEHRA